MSNCPIAIANAYGAEAADVAANSRAARDRDNLAVAIEWQELAADLYASAMLNRLLALHGDVDAAEAAFDAA